MEIKYEVKDYNDILTYMKTNASEIFTRKEH